MTIYAQAPMEGCAGGIRRHARMLDALSQSALDRPGEFETIKAYWRDPAPFEAEREREQAKLNAQIDAAVRRNHPHIGEGE